jgi:hypothetical protein
MTLKLNSRSSFNVKLNWFENFSWTWQWWQNLIKYSIAWEFVSWSDRSKIACKRRVEKWSNRRWRRRNSISMKKQEFWSSDFVINDCARMFQRRNAWSYRRIIEWCSFFIFVWRLFIIFKLLIEWCSIFILIWKSRTIFSFRVEDFELIKMWIWNLLIWFEDRSSISMLIRLLK